MLLIIVDVINTLTVLDDIMCVDPIDDSGSFSFLCVLYHVDLMNIF